MNIPKVLILSNGDDWEALYVNGTCVYQHHEIPRHDFLRFAEKYNFKSPEIVYATISEADNEKASIIGVFPNKLEDLIEMYE